MRYIINFLVEYRTSTPTRHPSSFAGNGNRLLFNTSERPDIPSVAIKDIRNNKVMLQGGAAHGVVKDFEHALFPWDVENIGEVEPSSQVKIFRGQS